MSMEKYRMESCPVCKKEAVVQGDKFRISVLTPALIRLEYEENGNFEYSSFGREETNLRIRVDFPQPASAVTTANMKPETAKKNMILAVEQVFRLISCR